MSVSEEKSDVKANQANSVPYGKGNEHHTLHLSKKSEIDPKLLKLQEHFRDKHSTG